MEQSPEVENSETRKSDLVCHICHRELNCPIITKTDQEKVMNLGLLMANHCGACHRDTMFVIQFMATVVNAVLLSTRFDINVPEVVQVFNEQKESAKKWLNGEFEDVSIRVQPVSGKLGVS